MNIKLRILSAVVARFALVLGLSAIEQTAYCGPVVNALPTGGNVAAGSASINQSGNTLNINQSSQRAVINWTGFDVGSQAQVNFNQPNAQAATLNYVNSSTKSMIDGAISANGQVVFVNNNGVVFGKNAQVNVGGMVATTMNTDANRFMAGDSIQTYTGTGSGKIVNKGQINGNHADSYIALMAPSVKNTGVITATVGNKNLIALLAGEKVSLTFAGSQLVSVSVDASTINALISNKLLIQTNGGQVIIAANAAQDLIGSTIKNTGQISASGISKSGGTVKLVADTVTQAGTVTADSNSDNGGAVIVQGNTVKLASGSITSAKGAVNGGLINVGTSNVKFTKNVDGTRSNLQVENLAKTVTVEQNALVDASSTKSGNGGEINVWSQVQTNVAGILKATGGAQGGNGGFIETSSNGILNIAQSAVINVAAATGKTGLWLLDPDSMTISGSTASAISNAAATANVTISVAGDLNVATGATLSSNSSAGTTLTLNASGALTNNGTINMGSSGAIVINATSVNLASGSSTTANQITATAQTITVNGSVASSGGSIGGVAMLANGIVLSGPVSANGSGSSSGAGATTSGTTTSSGSSSGTTSGGGSSSSTSSNSSTSTRPRSSNSGSGAGSGSGTTTSSSNSTNTSSDKSNSNSATGVAAAVTAATTAAVANIAASNNAVVTSNTNVINLAAAAGAGAINSALTSASTAAAAGVTTVINVAAGQVSGVTQAAMSLTVAPPSMSALGSQANSTPSQLASGGSVTLVATNNVTTTATASVTADASASVNAVSSSSPSAATGSAVGGQVNIRSFGGSANLGGLISANSPLGQAGSVSVVANEVNLNATVSANGTGGGSINLIATAGNVNLSNASVAANGSAGNGGSIQIAAQNTNQLTASKVTANGSNQGGFVSIGINNFSNNLSNTSGSGSTLAPPQVVAFNNAASFSDATILDSQTQISANAVISTAKNYNSTQAGTVYVVGNNALNTAAIMQANADNGGLIVLASPAGSYQNTGYIQTNGGAGLGGTITQSGLVSTALIGTTQESNGALGGGRITVGGDFSVNPTNSSSSLTPVSQLVSLDAKSSLSASNGNIVLFADQIQVNNSIFVAKNGTIAIGREGYAQGNKSSYTTVTNTNLTGSFVETSADSLNVDGNTVLASHWLLDPTNVTIGGTAGTSTGSNPINFTNQANISASQIQTALAAGTSVNIVTDGTITQSSAISLTNSSGTAATLTFDNTSGSKQNMTLAAITASGTSSTSFVAKSSGGNITVGGAINVTGTINIDNSFLNSSSASQTITSANIATAATNGQGMSMGGALTAGNIANAPNAITLIAVTAANYGVNLYANITATQGDIVIKGQTGNSAGGPGVYTQSATAITANSGNIYISGSATTTGTGNQGVYLNATSGNIAASGDVTIAGISNAASSTGMVVGVQYQQYILAGGNIYIGGDGSYAGIFANSLTVAKNGNLTMAGASLDSNGWAVFDATKAATGRTLSGSKGINSNPNSATNVTISTGPVTGTFNGLVAGGDINMWGYANGGYGLLQYYNITAGGNITLTGQNQQYGAAAVSYGLFVSDTGNIISNNGSINIYGSQYNTTSANQGAVEIQHTAPRMISAKNDINIAGYTSVNNGTAAFGVYATGLLLAGGNINLGGYGGISGVCVGDLSYLATVYAGGNFNVGNAALNSSNIATFASGPATATAPSGTAAFFTVATTNSTITTGPNQSTYTGLKAIGSAVISGASTSATGASGVYMGRGAGMYTAASWDITATNVGTTALSTFSMPSGSLTATSGGISINSSTTSTGSTMPGVISFSTTSTVPIVSAGGVTMTATGTTQTTIAALGASTITNATGNISVTATEIAGGGNIGITSSGAITQNANGGSISFVSNNKINQTGAVTVAANTSGTTSSVTYDTTGGNNLSTITSGALTLTGGAAASSAAINFIEKTSGASITAGAIAMPGYINLDMTNGGTVAASAATTATGITVNGNLSAGAYAGTTGINISGISTTGTAVQLNASTLTNAVGDIVVTGRQSSAGGATGINSTGAITQNANGGSITFTSNNAINQTGNVSIAANTTSASTITYDTTSGNYLSGITAGAVSVTAGSNKAIDYIEKSSGAPIMQTQLIAVPGSITLDNTYLNGSSGGLYFTTNQTTNLGSSNVTATNTTSTFSGVYAVQLNAGGNITLKGITNSPTEYNSGVSLGFCALTHCVSPTVVQSNIVAAGSITVNGYSFLTTTPGANWDTWGVVLGGSLTAGTGISITGASNSTSAVELRASPTTPLVTTLSTTNGNIVINGYATNTNFPTGVTAGPSAGIDVLNLITMRASNGSVNLTGVSGSISTNTAAYGFETRTNASAPVTLSISAKQVNIVGTNLFPTASTGYGVYLLNASITSTGGSFTSGQDAISIVGNNGPGGALVLGNANTGSTSITNSSSSGIIRMIANNGNFVDPVTVTSSSSSGAIYVSAIGSTAAVVSAAGTLFTQNSNDGIYITSSNSGNVSPPKIVNNGTGPVVIGAGVYLNAGDGTGGQITAVNGNTITSATGNVYLYSGNITGTTNLQYLSPKLTTLTFNDAQFNVAYRPGNVPATSLPETSYNITYVPVANSNPTTASTYGPMIQYRAAINYNLLLSSAASFTKVYGTLDPNTAAGTIATPGALDYLLNSKVVTTGNSAISTGNAVITITGTGYSFSDSSISISTLINSISGTRTTGLAYENVGNYNYSLASSIHGLTISVATGTSQPGTTSAVSLAITAAPLTITDNGANGVNAFVYNGISGTYSSIVTGAGLGLTGLVTTITTGGVATATSDAVASVTQTIRTGATIGVGTTLLATGTPNLSTLVTSGTTYNAVPSAAVGVNLSNYTITYVGNTYAVTNPTIYITASNQTKVYGASTTSTGAAFTLSSNTSTAANNLLGFTVSGSALPSGVTITGVTLASSGGVIGAIVGGGTGAGGAYTLTPSLLTYSGSLTGYNINYVSGLLTVTPKPITITANTTMVYGAGSTLASGTTTYATTGTVGSDSVTGATLAPVANLQSTAVGTYSSTVVSSAATGTGNFNSTNYAITYSPGTLTVTPKGLTITANNVVTTYGTGVALSSTAFSQSGLVTANGDAISGVNLQYSGTSSVPGTINVGTYSGTIAASGAVGSGLSNYTINYVAGNLQVNQALLTITASNQTTTYGSALALGTSAYTITSGQLFNGNTITGVTLSCNASICSGGPTTVPNTVNANPTGYSGAIIASAATGTAATSGNYAIAYLPGNLIINKAVATIAATKPYDALLTFTAGAAGTTFTVTGVNGQILTVTGSATANSADVLGVSSLSTTGLTLVNGVGATAGLATNYVLPSATTAVTVTPVTLSVTLAPQTKVYDSTVNALLTAGTSSSSGGSYTLSGFVGGQGAYITQTVGSYNTPCASTCLLGAVSTPAATSVTAALSPSNFVADTGTKLSNYTLPSSVTASGAITKASLTMTAADQAIFTGGSVANSYIVTGLVGSDTAATALSNANVTNTASAAATGVITGALVPSALSANYNITAVPGTLTVAANYQLLVTAGSKSVVYSTYQDTNILSAGGSLSPSSISVSYCTNCAANVASPNVINLTVTTTPSPNSNMWLATDNLGVGGATGPGTGQGQYTFTIAPTTTSTSFNGGATGYLNVGNYALLPANVTTVSGYSTNFGIGLPSGTPPVIYTAGTLTVTPLPLTFSSTIAARQYNGSNAISNVALTPSNVMSGDSVIVTGTGTYNSPNAGGAVAYTITSANLSGTHTSNYVFVGPVAGTGAITPAPISVSATNTVKTYDATTSVSGASISPAPTLVVGTLYNNSGVQDVLTGGSYAYTNPNAGSGDRTVTVSGVTVSNSATGNAVATVNYLITYVDNTTSTINPASVTINGSGVYNGSTTVANLSATGVGGQTLVINGGTGTMASANAGTNGLSAVSLTGATLSAGGTNPGIAANYTLVNPSLGSVVITPAVITVSASDTVKTYDTGTSVSGATTAPTPTLVSGTLYLNNGVQDTLTGGSYAYTDPNAGAGNKTVTVSGVTIANSATGNTAATANYTISYVNNFTSTINPATITINGAATYNGTNITGNLTATGVGGQTLVISGGSATMNSANAGTNSITGLTGGTIIAGGANPGNPANYTIVGPTFGSVVVSPAALTVSTVDVIKTFDNTTATTGTSVTQSPSPILISGTLFGSDALSGGTYAYTNANVQGASQSTVSVANVNVLNGATNVNTNYTISYQSNTTSTINPASLTISGLSVASATYNGTTNASLIGSPVLAGIIAGTSVSVTGAASAGTYASADAASSVAVTPNLSGLALSGASAANYVIAGVTSPLVGTISPAPLTALIVGSPTMTYNASTANTGLTSVNYQLSGFVSGQGASVTGANTGNYNSANVASANSITAALTPANFIATSGTNLSNYILPSSATGAGAITPASLTVTANNAAGFVGTAIATNGVTVSGLQGTDTAASALVSSSVNNTVGSAAPGIYTGALIPTATPSSNYVITNYVSGTLSVAAAGQLIISAGTGSVVYGTYNSTNVATAANAVSGTVTAAYCSNCVAGMVAAPNIITLTITAPAAGGTIWTASDAIGVGTGAQGIYSFTIDPNVPLSAYSIGGNVKVGTYSLTPSNVATLAGQTANYDTNLPVIYNAGSITVTPLVLNFAQGPTTTYNGSTNISNATLTPSNTVAGDNLTVSGLGTLTSPNANAGNASYAITSAILSGPDAANYLFLPSASGASGANATVLPAPITVSASNAIKTYDTTTASSGASVITAPSAVLVSGTLFTNTATGANDLISSVATVYQDPSAGTANKTLIVSNAVINNGSLNVTSNYAITYADNTASTINPAPLTVSGLSANNLVYNGGTAGTVSGTPTLVGAIAGASVSIASGTITQGNFATANAGNGIAVTPDLSGLVLSNQNYVITGPSTPLLASITPAPLTISGLTAANKVYNGGTSTAITGTPTLLGAIAGTPAVSLSAGSVVNTGSFASANVVTNGVVTPNLSGLSLTGPGASNYSIVGSTTNLIASITPAPLTVSLSTQSKVYDASTNATLLAGTTTSAGSYVMSGFLSGQGAYITQTAGSYNSPNVQSASTVSANLVPGNFVAYTGTLLSNYSLPTLATGLGTIAPAPLTVAANNVSTFIGVAPTLVGAYSVSGLKGVDTATDALVSASVSNTSNATGAGTYAAVLVPTAVAKPNYVIASLVSGSLTIASNLQLVVTAGNNSAVFGTYGASNQTNAVSSATAQYCTNCAVNNLNPTYVTLTVSGSGSSWTASDTYGSTYAFNINPNVAGSAYSNGGYINVGSYALQPSGITLVSGTTNYNAALPVIYNPGTLTITPFIISATPSVNGATTVSAVTQQYNGLSTIANVPLTLGGLPSGVALLATGSGAFASPNVAGSGGSAFAINSLVLSGPDAANFVFAGPLSAAGTITPAPIVVTSTSVVKTFDNTTATIGSNVSQVPSPVLLNGTLYTNGAVQDALSGGAYAYTDVNSGAGNKTVSVSAVDVINGANNLSSNYAITYVNNTASTINPAVLTVSGLSASDKTYNSTTSAVITGTPALSGNTYGLSLTLTGSVTSGSFVSPNAANNISVTPNLLGLSVGNANFVIAGPTAPLSASITPAPLTVSGLSAAAKVYDGSVAASLSGTPTLAGSTYGQFVTLSGAVNSGTFAQSDPGTGITVSPNLAGLSLNNPNFYIAGPTLAMVANIAPAPTASSAGGELLGNQSTVLPLVMVVHVPPTKAAVVVVVSSSPGETTRITEAPLMTLNQSVVTINNSVVKPLSLDIASNNNLAIDSGVKFIGGGAGASTINKPEPIYVRDSSRPDENILVIQPPSSGSLRFPVPDKTVQDLIDLSGSGFNRAVAQSNSDGSIKLLMLPDESTVVATLSSGEPLPEGIRYDASGKTFYVDRLSSITLPIEVKLTLKSSSQELAQKTILITK